MDKNKVKLVVDIALGLSFLLVAITGLLKWPGLMQNVFNLTYQDLKFRIISRIHDWSGAVMTLLVFIHLILNWPWIKSWFIKKRK